VKTFDFEGVTLYYSVEGVGIPVVLLHGFLEDHTMWNQVTEDLKLAGCQIITLDLPGHGKSRFYGDHCSMIWMAQAVHEILNYLALKNPFVFGHSMGGYVGLELLRLRPIHLTLVHSNFWADPPQKKIDRDRVIHIVAENKLLFIREAIPHLFAQVNREKCRSDIQHLIERAGLIPEQEIQACTAGMRDREDHTPLLKKHDIQIIHGDLDPIISTDQIESELQNLGLEKNLTIINNCGHMSIWEAPETLIKSIKKVIFQ
jgi:pimeloyl-ACP methyl ester carboxylesterase